MGKEKPERVFSWCIACSASSIALCDRVIEISLWSKEQNKSGRNTYFTNPHNFVELQHGIFVYFIFPQKVQRDLFFVTWILTTGMRKFNSSVELPGVLTGSDSKVEVWFSVSRAARRSVSSSRDLGQFTCCWLWSGQLVPGWPIVRIGSHWNSWLTITIRVFARLYFKFCYDVMKSIDLKYDFQYRQLWMFCWEGRAGGWSSHWRLFLTYTSSQHSIDTVYWSTQHLKIISISHLDFVIHMQVSIFRKLEIMQDFCSLFKSLCTTCYVGTLSWFSLNRRPHQCVTSSAQSVNAANHLVLHLICSERWRCILFC